MKKLVLLVVGIFMVGAGVFAMTPEAFRYTTIVVDSVGPLVNTEVSFDVKIFRTDTVGEPTVYREVFDSIVTDAEGIVKLDIGNGFAIVGVFDKIAWGNGILSVRVTVATVTPPEVLSEDVFPLLSVPYALHAKAAERLIYKENENRWVIDGNDLHTYGVGNVGIGTDWPDVPLHVVGSIKMVDGKQAAGHVMVSDTFGKASWIDPALIAHNSNKTFKEVLSEDKSFFGVTNFTNGELTPNGHTGSIYSAYNFARNKTGYAAYKIAGTYSYALNDATSGTVNNLFGDLSVAINNKTGRVVANCGTKAFSRNDDGLADNSYGAYVYSRQYGAGTITNSYGIYAKSYLTEGTIGTGYGGYFVSEGAGTNYGVYAEGAQYGIYSNEGVNYFAGSVGIGTTTPEYVLDVVGEAYASLGWKSASDKRFKKNIEPLTDPMVKLLKLQGVTYDWNIEKYPHKGFDTKKQIGFIAQEVEKLFPELVSTDKEGYKAVSYDKFTPLLVETIKVQQKQIEEQQKLLEELMRRVKALEKK